MIKLNFYQIVFVIVSAFILIDRTVKFIRKETRQSLFKYVSTLLLWIMLLLIALISSFARNISEQLGFGDNLNTLIYIGFIIVFVVIFKLLGVIERLERNITEIVRKEALRDFNK